MLKASMLLLFMTLLAQGQECDKTNLFQLKRTNVRVLGNQTALSELGAIDEVSCGSAAANTCPCGAPFDVADSDNNCKVEDVPVKECSTIPIGGSSYDENDPGALSDGCWNIPEGGCTKGSMNTTGKTDTTDGSTNKPTLCIQLPDQVCPSQVCIKTGNGGVGKVCYDTDGVTCTEVTDKTNKCETWITTSGYFCIVSPEFTKNGKEGSLKGISNFAIQWKCGDCGSGSSSSSTTAPFDPSSTTSTGGASGDPHMGTIDGEKYLLLQQGSFNFWQFSGLDAEVHSAGTVTKIPLDFRVFTHYSGHQSYTKSLLLVDQSGPDHAKHSSLEITSEDCIWRSKTAKGAWHTVEKPLLVSNLDDEISAMRLGLPTKPDEKMHVDFLVKEKNILRQIAKILVICKPGMHINTKLVMFQKEDFKYVTGQLGIHKDKAILLQDSSKLGQGKGYRVRTDSPFLTARSWTDLGGSGFAATYLSEVDEEKPAMFLADCDKEREDNAKVLCAKQLGGIPQAEIEDIMAECVFDVCRGGGEVAAKLFAEIYAAQ